MLIALMELFAASICVCVCDTMINNFFLHVLALVLHNLREFFWLLWLLNTETLGSCGSFTGLSKSQRRGNNGR